MSSKFFKVSIFLVGILLILGGSSKLEALKGERAWTVVRRGDWDTYFVDVQFLSKNKGWIVGAGMLLYTTNKGEDWKARRLPQIKTTRSAYFLNEHEGWILGERAVYHTGDGGKKWTKKSDISAYGYAIHFADSMKGWIVAAQGKILHTSDGGRSWVE